MCKHGCKLCVMSFAIALAITWALGVLLLGLAASMLNWGGALVALIGSVYVGYDASIVGALLGALYALVDAFIGGLIFAWLYNVIGHCCGQGISKCCRKHSKPDEVKEASKADSE